MKYYSLKSHSKNMDYMEILEETETGYKVKIVRDKDGYEEVVQDFMTKELFDTCVRTGYITEITDSKLNSVSA